MDSRKSAFQGNLAISFGLVSTLLVCSNVNIVKCQLVVPVPVPVPVSENMRPDRVAYSLVYYSPPAVISRRVSRTMSTIRAYSAMAARYGTVAAGSALLGAVGGGTGALVNVECPGGLVYSRGIYKCAGEDGLPRKA